VSWGLISSKKRRGAIKQVQSKDKRARNNIENHNLEKKADPEDQESGSIK
jgi:hypothetical protein